MTSHKATPRKITFFKSSLLLIGLGMIAALVACSSSNNKPTTPAPTISIAATSGGSQSAVVSTPFTSPLVATVTTTGTPASGIAVTFTAPTSGASVVFTGSTPVYSATVMTDSTGVATSPVFNANTSAGAYSVTATAAGATAPAAFSLTNTSGTAATITATAGTPQSTAVSTAFQSQLQATVVDSDSNPVSGAAVIFTAAPAANGASGTFGNGTATESDTTNASGVATSSTITANAIAGTYSVTAASGSASQASFTLTNKTAAATTLATGNYVFSSSGADGDGFYTVAGAFTVGSSGVGTATITGGEQDFANYNVFTHDDISSGMVTASSDGNLLINLTTCNGNDCATTDLNVGVNGVETLDASMVSTSKGLLVEFDSSATSSGEIDLQATNLSTPSGAYAFFITGVDASDAPLSVGGVIDVDGPGTISGTGSIFDVNDDGSPVPDQLFSASTVDPPDSFGFVTFTLNSSALTSQTLDGYIIDANHIRLVEDFLVDGGGTAGGTALLQTGAGNFNSASISGFSYVIGTAGAEIPNGALQVSGALTFNSDGSVTGNLSFNDIATQSQQGGATLAAESTTTPCSSGTAITPCYAIDASGTGNDGGTGRVTITNVVDNTVSPSFNYTLELYLTGDGHALVISMDSNDVLAGLGFQQANSTFTAASFNGSYSLNVGQVVPVSGTDFEQDGVGTVAADGIGSLTGFLDINESGTPAPGLSLSPPGSFATTQTNGVFTGIITDPVSGIPSSFTFYVVDPTTVVEIENDPFQLTLGYFEIQ